MENTTDESIAALKDLCPPLGHLHVPPGLKGKFAQDLHHLFSQGEYEKICDECHAERTSRFHVLTWKATCLQCSCKMELIHRRIVNEGFCLKESEMVQLPSITLRDPFSLGTDNTMRVYLKAHVESMLASKPGPQMMARACASAARFQQCPSASGLPGAAALLVINPELLKIRENHGLFPDPFLEEEKGTEITRVVGELKYTFLVGGTKGKRQAHDKRAKEGKVKREKHPPLKCVLCEKDDTVVEFSPHFRRREAKYKRCKSCM